MPASPARDSWRAARGRSLIRSRLVRAVGAARLFQSPVSSHGARGRRVRFSRMRSRTDYLVMNVPARRGFVNITPEVERRVRESGIQEGLVLVNAMHITASVFINDDEGGLHHD